ncbi:oxidoreductase [Auricularia subglabra TFB-10046 SS5]|nr:oxidoreductase [Auricularia subglabra TFB-10046 SS5]
MSESGLKSRKPQRIYTLEDVAQHASARDCWVAFNGTVYDVTDFVQDHPGGDDLILKHAGTDVRAAMADKDEHEHSKAAYEMLSEYAVGKIGSGVTTVSDDWVATDDFHPEDTNSAEDYETNQFLDLRKPLLPQVWFSHFSKSYYLQQVHNPRHLSKSARLFGPGYLEVFTLTAWYVIPIVWLPIATFLFFRSAAQFAGLHAPLITPVSPFAIPASAYIQTLPFFFIGNVLWTLLEYTLHRFLFHIDEWLPDKPVFLTLHFLLHGVHHYLPMDRLRLVMPPPLFFVLSFPFTRLAYAIFPTPIANGIISGAFAFYVLYDTMHYALHHTQLPQYMREMKKYHLAHHYKNFELGFGVTSKVWDVVFNTVLPV